MPRGRGGATDYAFASPLSLEECDALRNRSVSWLVASSFARLPKPVRLSDWLGIVSDYSGGAVLLANAQSALASAFPESGTFVSDSKPAADLFDLVPTIACPAHGVKPSRRANTSIPLA